MLYQICEYFFPSPKMREIENVSDAVESSANMRGRTTQCLGIILESQTLAVTANLLELIEKWKKIKRLGYK